MVKKKKAGRKAASKRQNAARKTAVAAASSKAGGWLKVCPNCGYQPKPQNFESRESNRFACPVCFFRGPAIQVKRQDYRPSAFEHQKMPEPHEGRMIWPEIILILVLSVLATVLLWKAARAAL